MKNLQSLFSLSLLSSLAFVASLGLSHGALAMSREEKKSRRKEEKSEAEYNSQIQKQPRARQLIDWSAPQKPEALVEEEPINPRASWFMIATRQAKPKKSLFCCASASTVQE